VAPHGVTGVLPSATADPLPAGSASQTAAVGYFVTGLPIPSAAFAATLPPKPYVTVGVVKSDLSLSLTDYPVPLGAVTVATADLNKDGNADLAVAFTGDLNAANPQGGVAILLGNGDGTFKPAVSYLTAYDAFGLAIQDLGRRWSFGHRRGSLHRQPQHPDGKRRRHIQRWLAHRCRQR
jgi:hypothetical protein